MATFLIYIMKSACCLVLFYLGYKILLSGETFFRFNRKVLLGGMTLCMLLPLVQLNMEAVPVQKPLIELEAFIIREVAGVDDAAADRAAVVPASEGTDSSFPWGIGMVSFYLLGIVGRIVCLTGSFISLHVILKRGCKIQRDGYTLVLIGRAIPPFSWGRYVVLAEKDYQVDGREILTHELVHFRNHHFLDLVYMEVLVLLQWFNPAVWLLKQELSAIHEYQADRGVLEQGINATKYQLLLVKKAVSASSYTFANSFNHSKIKKRITMMLKEKSNSRARLKLALLIPVAACTMLAFARPEMNRELESLVQSEGTTILQASKSYTREFFDKEIDGYIKKAGGGVLSGEERLAFMKSHTQVVPFFVNAKDQILYNNIHLQMSEMPEALKETLFTSTGAKPVMIFFLCDEQTSEGAVKKAQDLVGNAFEAYRFTEAGKEAPVLFFFGEPRMNFASKNNQK